MSKSSRCIGALAAVLLLASSSALWAQTTGRIQGQVADAQGAAVPGATVTVTSPALQGSLTQVSDGEGRFRFPSVPPGRYAIKSELASFKTVELNNVEVGLDRTATVPITMQLASVIESVTVTAMTPVIDSTSTITGVVAGAEILNRIPVRRDIYSATRFSAGVVDDAVGPTVYGSSGAENQYIIDGLNTTGVELGNKGKNVNMDFIEQVETKTGGLPAEYGRNTGGIVNAVTKSGSNVFRGSVFGFTEGGFLSADDSTRDRTSRDHHSSGGYFPPRRRRRDARRLYRQRQAVVLWLRRLRGSRDRHDRDSRNRVPWEVQPSTRSFRQPPRTHCSPAN